MANIRRYFTVNPSNIGADPDETSDNAPLLSAPISPSSISHSSQELDLADHCHGREPKQDASAKARRKLKVAMVLCTLFVTGEVFGGYYSGSLAIVGDAAHMLSDLVSFGLSLFVLWLSDKKPRKSMTFGYHKAEALGALATVLIIWIVAGVLGSMAIQRILDQDYEINDTAMLLVATAAVALNVLLGFTLLGCKVPHSHGGSGHSHGDSDSGESSGRQINIQAALIHVLGDFLQSIGVLISSLLIKFFGDSFKIADSICTLLFAFIVVVNTRTVLKKTLALLLDCTPANIKYDGVYQDLLNNDEVYKVHSLHIWSLTADLPVLSVHLATSPDADPEQVRTDTNKMLRNKHKIFRTTIQIENYDAQVMGSCDNCQPLVG